MSVIPYAQVLNGYRELHVTMYMCTYYRITVFNCVFKCLRFRDFKVIANLNIAFVWHMSYYLNRSGYLLVLVLVPRAKIRVRREKAKKQGWTVKTLAHVHGHHVY